VTKVLIIGDSISMGYIPEVQRRLADIAEVVHNPGNGGDSANVSAHIDDWLNAVEPDTVLLNCGLHDIKRQTGTRTYQVPIDDYRRNLLTILDCIRAADCRLLWVTTTPVIEARHQAVKDFDRYNADVTDYNAMAQAIVEDAEVAVIDLHAVALQAGLETVLGDDGVHFTQDGYDQLGRAVAHSLRQHIA